MQKTTLHDKIITIDDLSNITKKTKHFIKKDVKNAIIPQPARIGGALCWLREDVERYINENLVTK